MNTEEIQKPNDIPLILGTAGHIDHGKSSLVKRLTGVDPDRLSEEKKRGITIELGFGELELPSGRHLGVVDVPGHEKFVKQMIAGASGIDLGLLVIAADDGVMPQTKEHTQIMELLGIKRLVVALSKIDMVDEDWLELAKGDVEDFLSHTIFKDAEIIPVSSKTGEGIDELLAAIDRLTATVMQPQSFDQAMRLPIDRVFTLKGVGTVVTGTLWSGTVATDDVIYIYPEGREVRVRSVQVHSKSVERAFSGQRTALNLSGVDKSDIKRGDTVAEQDSLTERKTFDVYFNYLGKPDSEAAFVSGARVHINHGTTEIIGRILLTNNQAALAPGEGCFAQLRLESPLMVRAGDRFIVRSYSPVHLIGGGSILFTEPKHRTKLSLTEGDFLQAMLEQDWHKAIGDYLKMQTIPLDAKEIAKSLDLAEKKTKSVLAELKDQNLVVLQTNNKELYMDKDSYTSLLAKMEHKTIEFHHKEPLKEAISDAALRDLADKRISLPAFSALLKNAEDAGLLLLQDGEISHPQAGASARKAGERTKNMILDAYKTADLSPQFIDEMINALGLDSQLGKRMVRQLIQEGKLSKVNVEYYIYTPYYDKAIQDIISYFKEHGRADAAQIKDVLGVTRKYLIPFLEHLDASGITKREKDARVLRQ